MQIAEIGEFGLIARLTAGLPLGAGVVLGVGDDAAVLDPAGELIAATCDAQVQGVHFRLGQATPANIGWKALAVNLSDLAAMGATPRFALVSLLVPPDLSVATLDGIYAGLRDLAQRYGVAIVGGNVAAQPDRLAIDITALGTVARERIIRRAGARPGDHLLVTGTLGAAAAGLWAQDHPDAAAAMPADLLQAALAAQYAPEPRVAVGQALARYGVTAALDISDGLAADVSHLGAASGVGVEIDAARLPIAPAAWAAEPLAGRAALDLALFGGEDYELLLTVPAERAGDALAGLMQETGVPICDIGTIVVEQTIKVRRHATTAVLTPTGWDHLRPAQG